MDEGTQLMLAEVPASRIPRIGARHIVLRATIGQVVQARPGQLGRHAAAILCTLAQWLGGDAGMEAALESAIRGRGPVDGDESET
ncbi:MAG TPA: hypothetical protein VEA41_09895 [Salinarimonas sp.]|nr:hypothetical protein [Salinarimonas sp.]